MSNMNGPSRPRGGFTLIEILAALAAVGILVTAAVAWRSIDRFGLTRAARLAESHLVRARLHALTSHEPTEVTLSGTWLELKERSGAVLSRIDLAGAGFGRLDSVRIRPAILRFNARGHGSPGSLYLYRGRRGVRVVSNFVGRVRVVPFRT